MVEVPLTKIATTSTTYLAFLEMLGERKALKSYQSSFQYVSSPCLRKMHRDGLIEEKDAFADPPKIPDLEALGVQATFGRVQRRNSMASPPATSHVQTHRRRRVQVHPDDGHRRAAARRRAQGRRVRRVFGALLQPREGGGRGDPAHRRQLHVHEEGGRRCCARERARARALGAVLVGRDVRRRVVRGLVRRVGEHVVRRIDSRGGRVSYYSRRRGGLRVVGRALPVYRTAPRGRQGRRGDDLAGPLPRGPGRVRPEGVELCGNQMSGAPRHRATCFP